MLASIKFDFTDLHLVSPSGKSLLDQLVLLFYKAGSDHLMSSRDQLSARAKG